MVSHMRLQEGTQKKCKKTKFIILTGTTEIESLRSFMGGVLRELAQPRGGELWTSTSIEGQGGVQEKDVREFYWCI